MRLTGNPLNIFRLPIYPLFILIIYTVAGRDNLLAVSVVQGALFVLTTLEFYLLVALIFRRSWLACLVSIFVWTNVILISYGKPIMTEGLSLWLLTTNVLIAVSLMHTWNLRLVWAQVVFLLLLFFTRPEWVAFPIILFGYLLFIGRYSSFLRPLLMRVLVACGVLYVLVGAYIAGNSLVNHYVGLTSVAYDGVLSWLLSIQLILYRSNGLFPASALLWLGLLLWPETRKKRLVQTMGLVVLTALWGIVTTSLGGYYMADLMRVHIVFDPLITLTVWGTLWYVLWVIVHYMRGHAPGFLIVLRKLLLW